MRYGGERKWVWGFLVDEACFWFGNFGFWRVSEEAEVFKGKGIKEGKEKAYGISCT